MKYHEVIRNKTTKEMLCSTLWGQPSGAALTILLSFKMYMFHPGVSISKSQLCFHLQHPPNSLPASSRWCLKHLHPGHSEGRPILTFSLLTFIWHKPICYGIWGMGQYVQASPTSLSFSTLSFRFQGVNSEMWKEDHVWAQTQYLVT